jgi:hypothetical protein
MHGGGGGGKFAKASPQSEADVGHLAVTCPVLFTSDPLEPYLFTRGREQI